jgi:hypothetical protein
MPYPESDLIASFKWNSEPYRYPGTGSDMHWWTWGIDDAIYVLDDDGKNFEGPINYAHLLKVNRTPPNHKIETVTDFMEIPFRKMMPTDKMLNRYVDGIIAIDSLLYVSIYDYDWNLERNLPYFDSIRPRLVLYDCFAGVRDSTMLRNMWFSSSYSKNYGIAGIIKSTDFGKTWSNIPKATTPRFLGPKFAGLTFLNFGPGYSDVPRDLYPYVYAMSNDGSWETGDHVFMARLHKDSILNREAWQFLSSISPDNIPSWSKSEEKSFPVFNDPGHVGHPTISYNKNLGGIYWEFTAMWCLIAKTLHPKNGEPGIKPLKCNCTKVNTHGGPGKYSITKSLGVETNTPVIYLKSRINGGVKMDYQVPSCLPVIIQEITMNIMVL